MAIAAPVLHHGVASWANVFGPLIGGVFAFGIARGYLRLLRDAAERERLLASLSQAQQETADLQDELALTQRHAGRVDERTRLARDIHDTVAQNLSSIRLLAHAKHGAPEDPETGRAFEQIEALAGDGITDIRRIIAALTPSDLDDNALAAALARMLDRLAEQAGVRTELHVDDTLPELSTSTEVALMRTAQSALANVRLHARASRVDVSLIDDHDHVRLDVRDDGAGFDASGWERTSASTKGGYGLPFMRSRLRDLGGGLDIESTPGDGTALSAYLPLRSTTKEA
ncbi:MAG TPA: sensor histidine kinase, partial [Candidatus Agrococcus pullicola]|nr:sensor histidine kinase [Candidatus Agrococcus pullicola]